MDIVASFARVRFTISALDKASTESGRSVAEEIWERLSWSFEQDVADKPMAELLFAVRELGQLFHSDTGLDWHTTLKGREALALAIKEVLESEAPKQGAAVEDLFGPLDPTTVAHMLARHYRRFIERRNETERELRGLHKERGKS
jgi:hypothetical protein